MKVVWTKDFKEEKKRWKERHRNFKSLCSISKCCWWGKLKLNSYTALYLPMVFSDFGTNLYWSFTPSTTEFEGDLIIAMSMNRIIAFLGHQPLSIPSCEQLNRSAGGKNWGNLLDVFLQQPTLLACPERFPLDPSFFSPHKRLNVNQFITMKNVYQWLFGLNVGHLSCC